MTRAEAKEMFRTDKDAYGKPRSVMKKIDKIFNEFEKEKEDIQQWLRDEGYELLADKLSDSNSPKETEFDDEEFNSLYK